MKAQESQSTYNKSMTTFNYLNAEIYPYTVQYNFVVSGLYIYTLLINGISLFYSVSIRGIRISNILYQYT